MRVRMLDTTRHTDYGALQGPIVRDGMRQYEGDVVDVDDQTGNRWKILKLAEPTDAEPRRRTPAEPLFSAREGPVYDAMVGRPEAGPVLPTNVQPEVRAILDQQAAEIARLRAEVAAAQGAGPAADLTDEQRQNLADAGYGTSEAVAAASDEDLLKVPKIGPAAVAKLRGG